MRVGDYLEVAGNNCKVMSKDDEYIELDGFFLTRRQDGYWIACDLAGGAVTYRIGTESFFVPATAMFVDNSALENLSVSSPWDVLNGWNVRFIVSDHQITYMESTYHP